MRPSGASEEHYIMHYITQPNQSTKVFSFRLMISYTIANTIRIPSDLERKETREKEVFLKSRLPKSHVVTL